MKNKFKYDLCIIGGLGRVGLPLGILFAHKGLKVCLNDINTKHAALVKKGIMPFKDKGAQPLLKKTINKKKLDISLNYKCISDSKCIIITLGTDLDKKGNPEIKNFLKIINIIKKSLTKNQTIIVRSSVYPGTCEKILKIIKNRNIAYCPERIKQGYSIKELKKLPQIVSGFSKNAIDNASTLFKKISPKIIYSTISEAELIKFFTNAWRYIQFATVNEFFMICQNLNIDFEKIRKMMIDNYPRTKNMPKAGFAAGPCLYKDTAQLNTFFKNNFFLGNSAIKINEGLPNYIVKKISLKYNLKNKIVGILGMAFKANIDDSRNSLSYKLRKVLKSHGSNVICSDEYIKDRNFISKEKLIIKSDIIIIGAPHDIYKKINFKKKILFNIWDHNKNY